MEKTVVKFHLSFLSSQDWDADSMQKLSQYLVSDASIAHLDGFTDLASRKVSSECVLDVTGLHQLLLLARIKGPIWLTTSCPILASSLIRGPRGVGERFSFPIGRTNVKTVES